MVTHVDQHAIETDPPSVAVFMMAAEGNEDDRRVIAELVDQAHANRAPTRDLQKAGMTGRTIVGSLAAALGVRSSADPLTPEQTVVLEEIRKKYGVQPEEALRRGFCIRFFFW